jgi:uncharacterized repeat protein (TIGR01451 family)
MVYAVIIATGLLSILFMVGFSGVATAQPPDPFICSGKAFIVQNLSASLNEVDLDGTATLTPILPPAGIEYNNLGYRSTDGLLYALKLQGNGYGDGLVSIIQIDSTGNVVELGVPSGLPTGVQTRFDAGDISSDGNSMFITFGARSNDLQTTLGYNLKLYIVDLSGLPALPLPAVTVVNITGSNAWVNDLAYNPNDGMLYGGDQWGSGVGTPGQLSVLDPVTGVRTDYIVDTTAIGGGTFPRGTAFGAAWYDTTRDTVFLYRNSGTIYEIDVSDLAGTGPVALNSWSAPATTRNDGTFCPVNPSIDLEKTTNGFDADSPTGPVLNAGDPVTWQYNVTNTGNVPLENVTVTDDQGVIPIFVGGDDGNGVLDPGETWIYDAVGIAVVGQYANIANATGDYLGVTYFDTDPSHYLVQAVPAIDIEKTTNGRDADTPTGPSIIVGNAVTWQYNVTNTGNVPLENVTVTDDQGVIPIFVGGDDGNGVLDPGETWIYDAVGIAVAGQYSNIANATGDHLGVTYNDTDPSHYFGTDPEIAIEKTTDGHDADTPTGPVLNVGDMVTWQYNVTNTGNVPLTNITVTDDQGVVPVYQSGDDGDSILQPGETWIYNATGTVVPGQYSNIATAHGEYLGMTYSDTDPSHYIAGDPAIHIEKTTNGNDADTPTGPVLNVGDMVTWQYNVTNTGNVPLENITVTDDQGVVPVYQSGDDGDNILQPGETWIYNATGTVVSGQYANIGTAEGDYLGVTYNNTDPSHYLGTAPTIHLEKTTNGFDADSPTGPVLNAGDPVIWQYNVTNTGSVPLANITVTDDQGVIPVFVGGDNGNSILDPGETWIYDAVGIAVVGQYANIANATGDYLGVTYFDTDPSHYLVQAVPAIDIEKTTNGFDADTPTGPILYTGECITWQYNVTNTGNVPLENITVTDDQGVIPIYVGGDDGDNILQPGETWIYAAVGTAVVGQYANIGNATGDFLGETYFDTDPSHYLVEAEPAIHLEKSTNGADADTPTGPIIIVGDMVTWEYIVTNTGNVPLENITVIDDQGVIPVYQSGDDGDNILQPGEIWIFNATGTAVIGQYANIANATGDYLGETYFDTDPSHYFGADPQITIEKTTNGVDADLPTGPSLCCGDMVTWQYNVTNTGNVPLENITVTDDQGVIPIYQSGDDGDNILQPGETWIFSAMGTAIVGQYANIGNATGDFLGETYFDTDPSHYYGMDAPGVGTPGYWKNHPDAWPVDSITIGGVEYSKENAIKYMKKPTKKDMTYVMFQALVAAKLNVLIGNEYDLCALEAGIDFIAEADAWMAEHPLGSKVRANSDAWQVDGGEDLYELLDWYNNGYCFWAPPRM